jgi:phosphoribosylamine--glycine ligase
LVIGNGGREHALAWKIKKSPLLKKLFCIPGNPGTESIARNIAIDIKDFKKIKEFCLTQNISLVVVGPEVPLVDGITDFLEASGLHVFGPSGYAAQLEGSKTFSKNLMRDYNIPTAEYATFSDFNEAELYLKNIKKFPVVLKADGLAAGKGVLICQSLEEALSALKQIMSDKAFGDAGNTLLVEEFLDGDEVSVFVLCDGKNYCILPPSQDHKKIGEGDTGKNTGGMGAYAPAVIADKRLISIIEEKVIMPTLQAMTKKGHPYKGLLYVGIILVKGAPYVLEYNCRFGDPETQAVLPLVKSDIVPFLLDCAKGNLQNLNLEFEEKCALDVVLVSAGYPDSYEKGYPISGLNDLDNSVLCFHAGTVIKDGRTVTSGGRVLNLVALGDTFADCAKKVYKEIEKLKFTGMYFRRDIGYKVLSD